MYWWYLKTRRTGFTLIELMVVLSVVTLLISLVLPAIARSRRSAQTVICSSSLNQIGTMASAYASDHMDAIFSFSWRPRDWASCTTNDVDLRTALDVVQFDRESNAVQATALLRKLLSDETVGFNVNWWPNTRHSLLVLADHSGVSLPAKTFICPANAIQLRWMNLEKFTDDLPAIASATGSSLAVAKRFRAAPSYWMTAAATQPNIGQYGILPIDQYLYDITSSNNGLLRLGGRRLGEVAFPSQKVWLFDQQDRHSNRVQMFYAEAEASQPLLMFDGSVAMKKFANANRSGVPRLWRSYAGPFVPPKVEISYEPIAVLGDAPAMRSTIGTGGGYDVKFWYTHGGLRGIDFGGPNVDTRNWSP